MISEHLSHRDYLTHHALGWAYLFKRRFADAMAEIEEGLALNLSDAKSFAEVGYELIYLSEMEKAVEQVQKAVRHDPFHPDGTKMHLAGLTSSSAVTRRRYEQ